MNDEKLTIRVNIADRYYPLTIKKFEEEQVRKSAKLINDTVLQYKKLYVDKDEQDFLAMALLQYVTKLIELEAKQNIATFVEQIKEIDHDLEDYLQKEQNVL
ncbi:MAG: cell division protein ZapA [Bacteroidetes bacterium CG23_combo_of_CG06-09_8_20_14_all_32_9]|nr:MAG: cell division protein ZapA [Bacteroidetes bacterium CG23_combo_of_CG06-09_8_20_14_all_32_9]